MVVKLTVGASAGKMLCCDCLNPKCKRKVKVPGLLGCLSEAEIKAYRENKL